ncbi:protein trichome birefringence-like 16 [Cornus florida]|uniref:protein trichome birefringence-like 16 n=1 Tax=Cornus florida TaxID=4283 RepID=UPI002897FAFE|nr:protein trichome birefringence-like 16 [Cornus florida]
MKGGCYGLRVKQLSIGLIALFCMTILIWVSDRTPLLTSLLPPRNHLLQLSPGGAEILTGAPLSSSPSSMSHTYVNKDTPTNAEKDMVNKQGKQHFNASDQMVPAKSSPEISWMETNVIMTPIVKKGNISTGAEKEMVNEPEEPNFGASDPLGHANNSTEIRKTETNVTTTPAGKKACNYAIGKWVIDDSRPLYSGLGCKQWLSGMWACRLTQRTDFAYEKLRWRPKDCEMKEFTGSNFLKRMQDKTLAFVGDSLGRQQFQSLMCMITGGEERPDVIDVGREYGLVKARGAARPDGWAYRFPSTNTTVLYYWSASLCDLEPIDPKNRETDYAMHLDRPPAFLRHFIHKFDVLVLNTGHHWNRGKLKANRWIMHVGGVPNTNRKIAEIGGAKNLTIYSIVNWVNLQLPKYPGLKAFFRSMSPRHFFNGDWNTGGTCDNTTPLSGGKEVLHDKPGDSVAAGAVKGTRVQLLDITAISQLRDEGHISRYSIRATEGMQDCLHWCLPGVPDTWNEILFARI